MSRDVAIHWFRRDLRTAGNPALEAARTRTGGRVLGLFCFDSAFLSRPDFSPNRFAFFLATLRALRHELRAQGGDLLVVDERPQRAIPRLVEWLREKNTPPALLSFNRDYEPFALERDAEIDILCKKLKLGVHTERDHLILEPHELTKDGPGTFYQVFTPFSRKWERLLAEGEPGDRLDGKRLALDDYRRHATGKFRKNFSLTWAEMGAAPYPDALEDFTRQNRPRVTIPIPAAGTAAAWERLSAFRDHLAAYERARDVPAEDGTSRLSVFFKNGSLTPALAAAHLGLRDAKGTGPRKFLIELVWREFYYHVLFHRPEVENEDFQKRPKPLLWKENPEWLAAWQDGRTGFPIVDAGMRQLRTTGWMHNRVRMIVASFLTKDLLIDWREGARHFMRELLDGDLAPNCGGWQWAASTGCDPQPYFRIFNPWLQGKKFDPEGEYIARYVPELKGTAAKQLHRPDGNRPAAYAAPIVEHDRQRAQALALFKT